MEDQVRQILERPFPEEIRKQRQGPNGIVLTYVPLQAYLDRLAEAFAGSWSWELISRQQIEDQIVVEGRLTAAGVNKTGLGGAAVTRRRDNNKVVSLADDIKTAEADALKRACRLLGVGKELYCADDTDRQAIVARHSAPQRMPTKTAARTPAPAAAVDASNPVEGEAPAPAGRVTSAQMFKLRQLVAEAGEDWSAYRVSVRERHGINLEYADRGLASNLISERLAGAQKRRQNGSGNGYRRSP